MAFHAMMQSARQRHQGNVKAIVLGNYQYVWFSFGSSQSIAYLQKQTLAAIGKLDDKMSLDISETLHRERDQAMGLDAASVMLRRERDQAMGLDAASVTLRRARDQAMGLDAASVMLRRERDAMFQRNAAIGAQLADLTEPKSKISKHNREYFRDYFQPPQPIPVAPVTQNCLSCGADPTLAPPKIDDRTKFIAARNELIAQSEKPSRGRPSGLPALKEFVLECYDRQAQGCVKPQYEIASRMPGTNDDKSKARLLLGYVRDIKKFAAIS